MDKRKYGRTNEVENERMAGIMCGRATAWRCVRYLPTVGNVASKSEARNPKSDQQRSP
jgi:hypothetical protein